MNVVFKLNANLEQFIMQFVKLIKCLLISFVNLFLTIV